MSQTVTLSKCNAVKIARYLWEMARTYQDAIESCTFPGEYWPSEDGLRSSVAQDRRDIVEINRLLRKL